MRLGNPALDIASGHALGRPICGSFVMRTAALAIALMLAGWPASRVGAAETTPSAQPQDQAAEQVEQARVEGFRSARWGMTEAHMPELASLIAEGLRSNDPESVAGRTAAFRQQFAQLHYIRQ